MFVELYRFLISHKQLDVSGIGRFLLERRSAKIDFVDKLVQPPVYYIAFQSSHQSPSKNLFSWLANEWNISDRDAVVRFNDFAFDLKRKINEGSIIKWKGIGTLEKKENQIHFLPEEKIGIETPVAAEKVIREHAEHVMLVGEQERTSTEMEAWLHRPIKKVFLWWIVALVIGVLIIGFLGWYFNENGLDVSSMGNQRKIV